MNKAIKWWLLTILTVLITIPITACSDNDDSDNPANNSTESISGIYIGKLNIVGYPDDEAERAYVTLTRKSSSSVSCKIESEGWGVDMSEVNLSVTFNGNIVSLKSETSKVISGQIISGNLQLTYETGAGNIFQFLGTKD